MKPFCEIVVQHVLPGIRAILAKELMEKHEMTQQETANKLGITQAAISQYKRDIRGYKVELLRKNKVVLNEIENLAAKIASGELNASTATYEFCRICKVIRKENIICKLHQESFPSLHNCKECGSKDVCH